MSDSSINIVGHGFGMQGLQAFLHFLVSAGPVEFFSQGFKLMLTYAFAFKVNLVC